MPGCSANEMILWLNERNLCDEGPFDLQNSVWEFSQEKRKKEKYEQRFIPGKLIPAEKAEGDQGEQEKQKRLGESEYEESRPVTDAIPGR